MKTQKQIKALKKEIVKNSAINVGYYNTIINALPIYAITEAIKKISENQLIKKHASETEIQNILISEAVRITNYQDFKELTKYFFN